MISTKLACWEVMFQAVSSSMDYSPDFVRNLKLAYETSQIYS